MATWDVDITPVDIDRKEVNVTAVRTDGDDIRTYNVYSAIIATGDQKSALLNQIWNKYLTEVANESAADVLISNLESQAKANLEGRET